MAIQLPSSPHAESIPLSPSTTLEDITLPQSTLQVSFPEPSGKVDQDEEWFEFEDQGQRHRLRLHDYAEIYDTRGLYESLVYRALKCRSPERVVRPLEEAARAQGQSFADLRVVDLGAGNGIVGELLRRAGARELVGIDILPEAAKAARRDRPKTYVDYVVTDLTEPDPAAEERLQAFAPNCLVTVAALGFGDIPPEAFVKAFNLLPRGGWLAMCIKDRFLEKDDDSGFGRLVRGMVDDGTIQVVHRESYVHRMSIAGEELYYVAVVARKQRHARISR